MASKHRKQDKPAGKAKQQFKQKARKVTDPHKKKVAPQSKAAYSNRKKAGTPTKGVSERNRAPVPKSFRTKDIDIHAAAKIAAELKVEINRFKEKQGKVTLFDERLNSFFSLITPTFLNQHLPSDVAEFKSYLSRFHNKNVNYVVAFINWLEWASYEARGKMSKENSASQGKELSEEKSATQSSLAQKVAERSHVTALLNMCLRHNSSKRKQGLQTLVNYLNKQIGDGVDATSLEAFKATAHHSVLYGITRMILGMAVDDGAHIILCCDALFTALQNTRLTSSVVLSLMDEELALSTRMRAVKSRLSVKSGATSPNEIDDTIDPEDINDPTRGERNQRLTAALFTAAALVYSTKQLIIEEAVKLSCILCFCYVEQKATRVVSANVLFRLWERFPALLKSTDAMEWCTFAFFYYPKLEYYRPEAIQCLLRFMASPSSVKHLPPTVAEYLSLDPLKPSVMEQLANALFRNDQVTVNHPMQHPVWDDIFQLIRRRCACGESLQEHLSTFIHTVVVPYRRGSVELPRRVLFQELVTKLGQIAMQSSDHEERSQVIQIASQTVGFGKKITAKPSSLSELKQLPMAALQEKVADLITQYKYTKDSDGAAHSNRNWILGELRNVLLVPVREGVVCPYVNECAWFLFKYGFYPPKQSRDQKTQNRCIFLFSELFSFTLRGDLMRPRCTIKPLEVIALYLKKEQEGTTRYTTAVSNKKFKKARNLIVECLENNKSRSVLFYDSEDVDILLTLLFLLLSIDDPSNGDAVSFATNVVPDLTHFYLHGSLDSLDMLYDLLMALVLRKTSPLQVLPLMSCIRRIAIGYMQKFAKFIRSEETVNIILSPLKEAFNTDSREIARTKRLQNGGEEDSDEDEEENAEEGLEEEEEKEAQQKEGSESDEDAESEDSESMVEEAEDGEGTSTESETEEEVEEREEKNFVADGDTSSVDGEEEVEEEPPTQEYIEALKGMVGNVDLDHSYPVDTENKEKTDVMRSINIATKIGLQMTSPHIIHIFQVLLAIAREELKSSDDVIFKGCTSSLELLFLSKNRYFGSFLPALKLLQLLGDIQSYCRKVPYYLLKGSTVTPKQKGFIKYRLLRLKILSLRVFHYVSLLAFKNEAGEDVRIALSEYYKSIFCDRGWEMKRLLSGIKRDLYYYRQGFAWVIVPAAFEKFYEVSALDSRLRFRVFEGCCILLEGMLPRLSGLPLTLKQSCKKEICRFVQYFSIRQIYDMKHTLPYTFLHTIKHILLYNKRVGLETKWVEEKVVLPCLNDDSIQLSSASIRLLSEIEKLLGIVPKAKETKIPTSVKILHSQFSDDTSTVKKRKRAGAEKARTKVLKSILAFRNDDPTDEERAVKRRRREELRVEDRLQRQVLKEQTKTILSKEEREAKRRSILMAKQARIAKNKERKRRLYYAQQKSFERWREEKLSSANRPRKTKSA